MTPDANTIVNVKSGLRLIDDRSSVALLIVAFALTLVSVGAGAAELILRDVNIVELDRGAIVPHKVVIIRDGSIYSVSEVGAADAQASSAGAIVVDGTGKFLIPGLVEGHAHLGTEKMRFGPIRG